MNGTQNCRSRSKTKERKTLDTLLPPDEQRTTRVGIFGGFRVQGTSFAIGSRVVGWRITIMTPDGNQPYDCWVNHGRIYSVKFETPPPWDHHSRFVIGEPAEGIHPPIAASIFQAMKQWI